MGPVGGEGASLPPRAARADGGRDRPARRGVRRPRQGGGGGESAPGPVRSRERGMNPPSRRALDGGRIYGLKYRNPQRYRYRQDPRLTRQSRLCLPRPLWRGLGVGKHPVLHPLAKEEARGDPYAAANAPPPPPTSGPRCTWVGPVRVSASEERGGRRGLAQPREPRNL